MKYMTLALVGIGLAIGSSIVRGQAPGKAEAQAPAKAEPEMKTVEQKFAYAIGLSMGRNMKSQGVDLDPDLLAKGIKDALADKPGLTDKEIFEVQQAFQKLMMAKEAAAQGDPDKNLKAGQAFLAATKAKPGVDDSPQRRPVLGSAQVGAPPTARAPSRAIPIARQLPRHPGRRHRVRQLGLIERPKCCSWCRRRRRLERHHWDYDEPLNVTFLCGDCHDIADSMNSEAITA